MLRQSSRAHQLSDGTILAGLLAFRALNACLVKTFFSPDEYWQALEVGHRITFGYGYLTWEWDVGLRSVLHPALFAGLYKVLDLLALDDGALFIYAPRLLQSVFAAIADFYTYRFADRLFENQVTANWTLFLSVASWWNFFCSTRTLANSMEAALTIVALYYWPFNSPLTPSKITQAQSVAGTATDADSGAGAALSKAGAPSVTEASMDQFSLKGNRTTSLEIAFLTCVLRPTAAIMWVFLGTSLLFGYLRDGKRLSFVATIISVVFVGGRTIWVSAILDSALIYHGWILTPINFLRVNVLEGISLFYGSSPWHWYLSQGIPLLFGIYLPLVLHGIWRAWKTPSISGLNAALKHQVLYLSLWMLVIYSTLQHKEWRFLYPILYPLLPFAGDTLYKLSLLSARGWSRSRSMVVIVLVLLVINAVMAWYTTSVHQRGVVDVMAWIRDEARIEGQIRSVGFIMPCHSTPWFSSVHLRETAPLDMWFVTCKPPLGGVDAKTYKDESDIFYEDPVTFMDKRSAALIQDSRLEDSHLVLFEDLLHSWPSMSPWIESHGYRECARFFNSHFHDDSRRRGDVLVYCTT